MQNGAVKDRKYSMRVNKSFIKYITAMLLFGSNGLVASYIALSSYEIVFLRTLTGGIFLLAIFLFSKGKFQALKNKKHFMYLILSGAAMGASWMLLYEGYQQIGVSMATLAYYIGPVFVMALSPVLFKEKLTTVKVLGILAALFGMFLVDREAILHSGLSWGLLCGILAAAMYACMVIFNKKAKSITGLENAVWQLLAAFSTVAVFMLFKQGLFFPVAAQSILPILILGIVNTGIGCYLYFSSIDRLRAQSVAICGYMEPLSALLFSTVFLQEHLSWVQTAGAVLIFLGAVLGEYWGRIKLPGSRKKT